MTTTDTRIKQYLVSINGHIINIIEATSEKQALARAIYLYGVTVDIKEK